MDDPSSFSGAVRGAELAVQLRKDWLTLSDREFDLLYETCVRHTDSEIEADITIQTCWDADRLDLGRVGISPAPKFLCTTAAKRPDFLKWADGRACFEIVPDLVEKEWGIDKMA